MSKTYQIAVLAGDGIGKEVMPEGLRATMAAAKRFGLDLQLHTFEWARCDYYAEHGKMMPDDWKAQLSGMDAIFFGAVGWPATVPDHVSLWGSLLKFRREFDQYINLRPVRLFEGVPCPLAGRKPGDIDYYVVRENTEGEYTSLGGVDVRRHRPRNRHPGIGLLAPRRQPPAQVRFRPGPKPPQEARHPGHQEQRHRHQHALVDKRADEVRQGLPRDHAGQAAHRHPHRPLCAATRPL